MFSSGSGTQSGDVERGLGWVWVDAGLQGSGYARCSMSWTLRVAMGDGGRFGLGRRGGAARACNRKIYEINRNKHILVNHWSFRFYQEDSTEINY